MPPRLPASFCAVGGGGSFCAVGGQDARLPGASFLCSRLGGRFFLHCLPAMFFAPGFAFFPPIHGNVEAEGLLIIITDLICRLLVQCQQVCALWPRGKSLAVAGLPTRWRGGAGLGWQHLR